MDTTVVIETRPAEGCIVLDICAENFTYPQSAVLKVKVAELLDQGHRAFLFNFTQVHLVDSYGLATIISALKMIKEKGGALALYGLNDMFTHLVEITHLDRVLEVWSTEAQASYYLSGMVKNAASH